MAELLQKDKTNWDISPVPMSQDVDFGAGNDDDEDFLDEISPEMSEEANLSNDSVEVANSISDLYNAGVLHKDMHDHHVATCTKPHSRGYQKVLYQCLKLSSYLVPNKAMMARSSIASFAPM